MRTKDGKSRQFVFIGFRTEQQAEEALKYFNNSYMDTSRITYEIARKVGDPNIPRPWSRHSEAKQVTINEDKKKTGGAKSSNLVGSKGEPKKPKKSNEINDPHLKEFLQVMQPRMKSKLWANDTLGNNPVDQNGRSGGEETRLDKGDRKQSVPLKVKLDEHDETEKGPSGTQSAKQAHDLAQNKVLSDLDYFQSRVKKEWSDSGSGSDDDGSVNESLDGKVVDAEESRDVHIRDSSQEKAEEEGPSEGSDEMLDSENPSSALGDMRKQILETGRLFVRNLPYTATEEDLMEIFSKFGDVLEVHLVVDKDTRRSKRIAYVLYTLPESAVRALEELDNSIFQGRLLHILPAKQQNSTKKQDWLLLFCKPNATGQASKTLKQQNEDQRKASEASGDTRAWNSLFMRPDTVVENIARKYGVSKSDFLDWEADDLAVRVALGETHVMSETKKALVNAGVNISAVEEVASGKIDCLKRSNHVLLVKNLPYGSSEGELTKMFGKFGSLDKFILPPTKTLALVVFLEAGEARAASKGLAYKCYKDAPLYLEWAPGNILSPSSTSEADAQNNGIVGEQDVKRVLLEQRVEGISEADIDPDRVESRSLFVKNLNFRTSDESLKKHFSEKIKEGRIQSVTVKKHVKNGKNVSMGFGFIEFDSVETAANVCRDLQGTILDEHALILQLCHAKKDVQVLKKVDKDKSSTKLIVRNVAFEAIEKYLRQLFSPFGQIKSLRLPMKFGNHRGFAFIEFVTKQEAQNVLQQLSSVHLYGRHLVLERAKEGESLEELRARTAAQFTDEQNGFQNTKLSKKRKHLDVMDDSGVMFEKIAR